MSKGRPIPGATDLFSEHTREMQPHGLIQARSIKAKDHLSRRRARCRIQKLRLPWFWFAYDDWRSAGRPVDAAKAMKTPNGLLQYCRRPQQPRLQKAEG